MRIRIFILLIFIITKLPAQTGGDNTYEFLNLSTQSLITSLGGMNVSTSVNDPATSHYNPALLKHETVGYLSFNYANLLAGINYGSACYSTYIKKYGLFAAGVTYLNYGKFDKADPNGALNGTFLASEYVLHLTWSYRIDSMFNVGVNFKPIYSHLESYSSLGFAFDIGGNYTSKNGLLTAGLAIRNIGTQIITYNGVREKLPFEIILGLSTKLEHAPFRVSITARNLEKYDLIHEYYKPDELSPSELKGVGKIGENVLRHLILGVEFLPSENFYLSGGFNYKKRKELVVEARSSLIGFSFGAGIKLSSFSLSISRARYHLAGAATNVSLVLKPSILKVRNKKN